MRERMREIAERVREACARAAVDGYRDAAASGLCHEGAVEASVGAIRMLDLDAILEEGARAARDAG